MAATEDPLDISSLSSSSSATRRIWLGGAIPADRPLPGFDVVVLAAAEHQPERMAFTGRVHRARLVGLEQQGDLHRLVMAAREVASALANGRVVLVSGGAGLERSAAIAAIGIGMRTRLTADQIIGMIRERRSPLALQSTSAQALVRRLVRGPR